MSCYDYDEKTKENHQIKIVLKEARERRPFYLKGIEFRAVRCCS